MCGERLEMSYVVAVIWWKKFSDNLFISFVFFILLINIITCIPILTLHVTGCKISLFGRLTAGLLFFFVITHACNICIFNSTERWCHKFIHGYDLTSSLSSDVGCNLEVFNEWTSGLDGTEHFSGFCWTEMHDRWSYLDVGSLFGCCKGYYESTVIKSST